MKILIELPTWLGDSIMVSPAIENIANSFDNVEITLIGSNTSVEALKNHPKVVASLVINKNYLSLYKYARLLGDFDTFFCFRGSIRSKIFKSLISSRSKFQFNKKKYPNRHQVERYCHFVNDSLRTNLPSGKLIVNLPKVEETQEKLKPLVGINPGAVYGSSKRWFPEKYAKVAIKLASKYDILIFGSRSEVAIADEIEELLQKNDITNYKNLAGKTSLVELTRLIKHLDFFITGDSGPMHLAAAFQIPTISIFGPTKADETSQWMNKKSFIVQTNLDCQPCMKRSCPLGHNNCMRLITEDQVLNAMKNIS